MQYEEVVKMIKESEAKVDEVLKAARLQRNENGKMSKDKLELILNFVRDILLGIGIFVGVIAFFYLMSH